MEESNSPSGPVSPVANRGNVSDHESPTAKSGWTSVRSVSEAEEMNPSCRNTMEDAHCALDNFAGEEAQGLFAVFDGHGGRGVVDFLSRSFAKQLEEELSFELPGGGGRPILECITSSFLITDIQISKEGLMLSGSTAVVCLVRQEEEERMLYCANVGDSRAVLCRDGVAKRLTYDHKASDPSEIARIESAGGFVLRHRVLGILSVSRSFGDHAMKQFVVARPHVEATSIKPEDTFLIIACDGVWDVLTDQEAVDFVKKLQEVGVPSKEWAQKLIDEALSRGSTDNITVLVVEL